MGLVVARRQQFCGGRCESGDKKELVAFDRQCFPFFTRGKILVIPEPVFLLHGAKLVFSFHPHNFYGGFFGVTSMGERFRRRFSRNRIVTRLTYLTFVHAPWLRTPTASRCVHTRRHPVRAVSRLVFSSRRLVKPVCRACFCAKSTRKGNPCGAAFFSYAKIQNFRARSKKC